MKRYGYCATNLSLDDAWNKSLIFFEEHKVKVKDHYISRNNLYRKLTLRSGFSVHPYGTSMGETYDLIFGYNPSDSKTYISISVKYSNFGRGIPSKVPKDMMKEWAYEMGINPMKLVKEVDYNFLANLDKIQEIPLDQIANLSRIFCAICGEENSRKNNYCVSCGTELNI